MQIIKYFLLTFFFLLFGIKSHSQNIDSLHLYNDIQDIFPKNPIKNDFYVFLVNPNIGANTNGHTLLVSYNKIRKKSKTLPIFYVFDKSDNVTETQLNDYFEKILKIPNNDVHIQKVINRKVFEKYQDKKLTQILYVYKKKKVFQQTLKFFNIENIDTFPADIFQLQATPTKIPLDTNYLHIGMSFYFPMGDKILQMSEVDSRISLINPMTGKIEKILANDERLNPLVLHKKYITQDKEALKIAKENHKFFKETNRLDKPFYNAFLGADGNIYITFSISICEKTKKELKIDGGEGIKGTVKKGEIIAELYLFLLKCDKNLEILDIYYTSQDENIKEMKWLSPNLDDIMWCDGKNLYAFNEPIEYIKDSIINPKYNYAISRLELQKGKAIFKEKLSPKMFSNIFNAQAMTNNSTFFEWKNKKYACLDFMPFIYEIGQEIPIYQYKGIKNMPKKPDYFPQNMEDGKNIFINYRLRKQGIIDNDYFYILYDCQDKTIIEIVDKNFKIVQQIFIQNQNYNLIFLNGAFYEPINEKGKYYLLRYALEKQ